jgi:arylsulfatase A-like enzyme
MISCIDKYIGQIIDHLERLGLAENTLVVFTSDHGHFYGHHGLIAKGPFHYEDLIRVPFIVRQPGTIPAGVVSDALQSLVDLPQTFLSLCGIAPVPGMTGVDQSAVWLGRASHARDHVIVENRHQPTTIHARTLINRRYKITVYCDRDYGEIFDLHTDPGEVNNLWAQADLRAALLEKLLWAEIGKEEPLTTESAGLANKSAAMYTRKLSNSEYSIQVSPADANCRLYNLKNDPDQRENLWDNPAYSEARRQMVRALLFERMRHEPLWMPRIAPA